MALTTTPASTEIEKWKRTFWREFSRDNAFSPYIGRAENGMRSVIHQCYETTDAGEQVTIPLVGKLIAGGVVGSATLQGNEEEMDQYGHKITIDWLRNAVALNKKEQHKSAADQMAVVRPLLTEWAQNKMRDDIIQAMGSIDGVLYGAATDGQKDTWTVNNTDRVIFAGGYNADHSMALSAITANDTMSAALVTLAKRRAKNGTPGIRPIRVNGGREYFVMFHNSYSFRDLKDDPVMQQANREARARDVNSNPIFQDGDLIYDGVINVEIPEMSALIQAGAGATGDVAASYLCGAQAVGHGIGQMPSPTTRSDTDYGFIMGRGVEMCWGLSKVIFNGARTGSANKDWGIVTTWAASDADA